MKRTILVLFFCFFFLSAIAYAHPPQDIMVTFDKQMKILQAIIVHNVKNPENHYIKRVDVSLNGKEILTHFISRQDNNETQIVTYLIPDAKDGDVISVEGYCSINGALEKKIEAGK